MKIYVESKDDIIEAKTDARGRVTLGSEYKDSEVQLAILEVDSESDDSSQTISE